MAGDTAAERRPSSAATDAWLPSDLPDFEDFEDLTFRFKNDLFCRGFLSLVCVQGRKGHL